MESDTVDAMVARWTEQRPDLNVSSMNVLSRVSLAHRLFARIVERQYGRAGINGPAFDVLAMLRQVGTPYRLTPTQLYTSLHVSSGTMTNRIDGLERMGLVVRIPDPHDRRGLQVELTPSGREIVDRLVAGHAALGTAIVDAIPAGEQDCLVAGLRDLILSLERIDREDSSTLIPSYMREPGPRETGRTEDSGI